MKPALTIDQFDVRYHDVRPGEAEELDRALELLIDSELPLSDLGSAASRAEHVCIPDLSIEIEVEDPGDHRRTAALWTLALRDEIERRIIQGSGVVLYRSTAEAVADLVRGVVSGDTQRTWAWKQVGILNLGRVAPTADDVARILAAEPFVLSSVVTEVGQLNGLGLSGAQWIQVSRSLDSHLPAEIRRSSAQSDRGVDVPSERERWLAAQLPWEGSDGVDQRRLARLVLHCTTPIDATVPSRIDEVVARWTGVESVLWRAPHATGQSGVEKPGPYTRSRRRNRVGSGDSDVVVESADAPIVNARVVGEHAGPQDSTPSVEAESGSRNADGRASLGNWDGSSRNLEQRAEAGFEDDLALGDDGTDMIDAELASSLFGGVGFLPHCFVDGGVVDGILTEVCSVDASSALAHVITCVTGAGFDDPLVKLISGLDHGDVADREPSAEDAQALELLANRVVDWHRDRLDLEPNEDLDWLWRRRATLDARPGWAVIELPLDSVDLRVRRAGLDLDPGFVWWIGAVVRYRYV